MIFIRELSILWIISVVFQTAIRAKRRMVGRKKKRKVKKVKTVEPHLEPKDSESNDESRKLSSSESSRNLYDTTAILENLDESYQKFIAGQDDRKSGTDDSSKLQSTRIRTKSEDNEFDSRTNNSSTSKSSASVETTNLHDLSEEFVHRYDTDLSKSGTYNSSDLETVKSADFQESSEKFVSRYAIDLSESKTDDSSRSKFSVIEAKNASDESGSQTKNSFLSENSETEPKDTDDERESRPQNSLTSKCQTKRYFLRFECCQFTINSESVPFLFTASSAIKSQASRKAAPRKARAAERSKSIDSNNSGKFKSLRFTINVYVAHTLLCLLATHSFIYIF